MKVFSRNGYHSKKSQRKSNYSMRKKQPALPKETLDAVQESGNYNYDAKIAQTKLIKQKDFHEALNRIQMENLDLTNRYILIEYTPTCLLSVPGGAPHPNQIPAGGLLQRGDLQQPAPLLSYPPSVPLRRLTSSSPAFYINVHGAETHLPDLFVNINHSSRFWSTILSFAFIFAGLYYIEWKLQSSGGAGGSPMQILSRSSQGKEYEVKKVSRTHFSDVEGIDEIKEEILFLSEYLKDPKTFVGSGAAIPHGVLLSGPPGTRTLLSDGPPGCGKTLLAKALAYESGVSFFYATGSEFDEVFVGVGAQRVRDLFSQAKERAPSIVFIDEIDSIGARRSHGSNSRSSDNMTINQLLTEMGGFHSSDGVIVIGATNMPEILDSALTRSGRFDLKLNIRLPDLEGRERILWQHAKNKHFDETVNFRSIARQTPGASGADLANVVNQAALTAIVDGREKFSQPDLENSLEKIIMGSERKSAVIPPDVLKNTAYHESGHALAAALTPGTSEIRKATIIPRGPALGMVSQIPSEESSFQRSRENLEAEIVVCMGGRAAEELIFGAEQVTTGASSDLKQASTIARQMVAMYGMNSRHGNEYISGEQYDWISPASKLEIDQEVSQLLRRCYDRARALLSDNLDLLHTLAEDLLQQETLTGAEICAIVNR